MHAGVGCNKSISCIEVSAYPTLVMAGMDQVYLDERDPSLAGDKGGKSREVNDFNDFAVLTGSELCRARNAKTPRTAYTNIEGWHQCVEGDRGD